MQIDDRVECQDFGTLSQQCDKGRPLTDSCRSFQLQIGHNVDCQDFGSANMKGGRRSH